MNIAFVPLGNVAHLQAGVGFPLDLQGRSTGKYPLAKVGDISRVGRSGEAVLTTADHYIEEDDLKRLKARPIPKGSVLFAKIGEAIRQNHRVLAGRAMLIDNNAMAAVPGPDIEGRYLYHFLRTVDFYAMASSTTVPALRKTQLDLIPVPLPPLPEQRRIGAILDRADTLRAKRRLALAALDNLITSVFFTMFGDATANSNDIGVLRDLCEMYQPQTISGKDLVEGGRYPVYGANGRIGFYNQFNHADTVVTVTCRGATCGTVNVIPGASWITGNSMVVKPLDNRLDTTYLAQALRNLDYPAIITGAAQPQITRQSLERATLRVPPLAQQRQFSSFASAVNCQIDRQLQVLGLHDELFASLQGRAFRGEL